MEFLRRADDHNPVVELGAGRFEKVGAVRSPTRIGIEICPEYVKTFSCAGVVKVCGDMRDYRKLIPGHIPIGCALLIDSLEHLEKQSGLDLIESLQADSRKILVFTPRGYLEQEDDAWGYGNKYQRHLSGWDEQDLTELDFMVWSSDECDSIFAEWVSDS